MTNSYPFSTYVNSNIDHSTLNGNAEEKSRPLQQIQTYKYVKMSIKSVNIN